MLIAGDLRESTPRILCAVHRAIIDGGFVAEYHGRIPTPALAHYAFSQHQPCIMVTGGHLSGDRNGLLLFHPRGEVLKANEAPIMQAVSGIRQWLYAQDGNQAPFNAQGMLPAGDLPPEQTGARDAYRNRYVSTFGVQALRDARIIFYQHSAVGRDLLTDLLQTLGAEVIAVGRSETFVPLDSENMTPAYQNYFQQLAAQHRGAFAIVSTSSDSSSPILADEHGQFHSGDTLGVQVAIWCGTDFAAFPVNASDALDVYLGSNHISCQRTKVGSPHVLDAMYQASLGGKARVVGWEANGGFMLGADLMIGTGLLSALPTRDALLPIVATLIAARSQGLALSELFARLPQRFSESGLITNFPLEISRALITAFTDDTPENRQELAFYFTPAKGFGDVTQVDSLDGIRILFSNGDIAHMRPSGNSPELRIYAVASSQQRADAIVAAAIADDGIFHQMASNVVQT